MTAPWGGKSKALLMVIRDFSPSAVVTITSSLFCISIILLTHLPTECVVGEFSAASEIVQKHLAQTSVHPDIELQKHVQSSEL